MSRPPDAVVPGRGAWRRLEHVFDAAFGASDNPMRQLGTLGMLCLWLLVLSGIYLFIYFDTSLDGAYESIVDLSRRQPWAGGLVRSLHRYGADALVLLLGAHLLRELLFGHDHGARRYGWLTGIPTIALVFVSAVGGF